MRKRGRVFLSRQIEEPLSSSFLFLLPILTLSSSTYFSSLSALTSDIQSPPLVRRFRVSLLSVRLGVCLTVCLSACLSVCLTLFLSLCLCLSLFLFFSFSLSKKGATDLLFPKATYYKKREGLGSPQWHFNTYPSVLLTEYFSEKMCF